MMKPLATLNFVLILGVAFAIPRPQEKVSVEDILANEARYGQSSGAANPDILNALFGDLSKKPVKGGLVKPAAERQQEPNYGVPAKTVVDSVDKPCSYYFDAGYRCVPYYQCENGEVVVDGAGLFDIRSGLAAVTLDPSKSKCPGDLEICCLHPDFEKPPVQPDQPLPPVPIPAPLPSPVPAVPSTLPPAIINQQPVQPIEPVQPVTPVKPVTPVQPVNPLTDTISPGYPQGPGAREPLTEPPKPKPYISQCGQRHTGGIGVRIQNSKETSGTQFGEWPNMCAVLNTTVDDVNLYVCGCSLISDRVVLTAAHCVSRLSASQIKVRAGEWDTQKAIEPHPHQDRYAKHISIHPGFNPTNLHDDFALIHLSEPFVLAPHIDVACLPDNLGHADFIPEHCYATGWGKDRFGKAGEYQVIMKKVELDLVPHADCQYELRKTRLGQYFQLDDSFTCAGGEPGKDTCTGDGGGPLVCPTGPANQYGEQTYVQVGIVAWGIGCGEAIPGVYANVSQALCFIDWATRCVEGQNVNMYGFEGCLDWARREYCILQDKIQILIEEENAVDPEDFVQRGKIRRQRKRYEDQLLNYEAAIGDCPNSDQDLSCGAANSYGEIDLTPHQRDASKVNINPRTALIEEVEVAPVEEEDSTDLPNEDTTVEPLEE